MSYATGNNSFGWGLTSINKVCKKIDYIIEGIFVFFYQSDLSIEDLIRYENMTQ